MTEGSYYGVGLALASGGVSRTNTAKIHDQYGNGLANQVVTFTVASTTGTTDVAEPFTAGATRTSDTTGTATMSYTDLQTLTAKIVTTASPAVGTDATSTYYRVDGTTPAFAEVDNGSGDGATVAATFTLAHTTGVATFNANHLLETGDEVQVTTPAFTAAVGGNITNVAAANSGGNWLTASDTTATIAVNDMVRFTTLCAGCNTAAADTTYWVTAVTSAHVNIAATRGGANIGTSANSTGDGVMVEVVIPETSFYFNKVDATTGTFHASRTVSALGATVYATKHSHAIVSATNSGVAKKLSTIVHASDRYMEVMIADAANDKIVVASILAADNWDYHVYSYDSGDQFNVYADTVANLDSGATAAKTATTLAGIELHTGAKMNALTGVPKAEFRGDIQSIVYNNAAVGGGVSVFNLGS
jgi:hypothetical protein